MEYKLKVYATVSAIILLCLCAYDSHGIHISADATSNAVFNIIKLPSVNKFIADGLELKSADCDCGKNSVSCEIDIFGEKACNCNPGYAAVEDGICKKTCKEYDCDNDGVCDTVCRCPKHVSGDKCETIDKCLYYRMCGDPKDATCGYYDEKSRTANCRCINSSLSFDRYDHLCKDCNCGGHGKRCYFDQGKTVCTCDNGYALTDGTCKKCDCGMYAKGCSFSEDGQQVCECEVGYGQLIETCVECGCGKGANCHLYHTTEICDCLVGYKEYNKTCRECNCGDFGKCDLDANGDKICYCDPGYEVKDGKCTACFCGSYKIKCSFENGDRKCICPNGYEDKNGYCEDIDECEVSSACPDASTCVNTIGSYKCLCNEGFRATSTYSEPKTVICQDIDECKAPNICSFKNTVCINTIGSYKCQCADGYSDLDFYADSKLLQCSAENNRLANTSWKTALIIVIVLMAVIFVAVPLFLYIRKRRSYAR